MGLKPRGAFPLGVGMGGRTSVGTFYSQVAASAAHIRYQGDLGLML